MTTDTAWQSLWDDVFAGRAWGKYPPEDLIRFVARNYYRHPDRASVKILEVGCGPGANLWYLAREGFSAFGIDGSDVAIARARARLTSENLRADLKVGDINALDSLYPKAAFDAVVDVGCLVCFTAAGQKAALGRIGGVLKPGGRVFSRLFGRGSWGDGDGSEIEPGTFTDIAAGPLAGIGRVRFCSIDEVRSLFAGFEDVTIETSRQSYESRTREMVNLIVTARKA